QRIESVSKASARTERSLRQGGRVDRRWTRRDGGVDHSPRVDCGFGVRVSREESSGSTCGGADALARRCFSILVERSLDDRVLDKRAHVLVVKKWDAHGDSARADRRQPGARLARWEHYRRVRWRLLQQLQ